MRPLDHVPTSFGGDSDVRGQPNLDAPSKKTIRLCFAVVRKVALGNSIGCSRAVEKRSAGRVGIRREAAARNRVSQHQLSCQLSHRLIGIQSVSFHSQADITREEVSGSGSSTVSVINAPAYICGMSVAA
jgi:hypothetical protein